MSRQGDPPVICDLKTCSDRGDYGMCYMAEFYKSCAKHMASEQVKEVNRRDGFDNKNSSCK